MNVLIADFLFVKEHLTVNVNTIKALALFSQVSIISQNNYYDSYLKELNNRVQIINSNVKGNREGKISGKLFSMRLINEAIRIYREGEYDFIIVLAFDSIVMSLNGWLLPKNKTMIIHHKNLDEILSNKFKSILFSLYKNNTFHIVYEKYFAEVLKQKVSEKRIFHIPHPVSYVEDINYHTQNNRFDCVALCNSNNELFIDKLYELGISNFGGSILIRSKKKRQSTNHFVFINRFLTYEEYSQLIRGSKCVFVPLPNHYKYRLSGSIYDALVRRKIVFTNSKIHQEGLNKLYPGIIKYVGTPEDLIKGINEINENDGMFDKFIVDHSVNNVSNEFRKILLKLKK